MGERVPIRVAKEIAKANGFKQVILCAWDGERALAVVRAGRSPHGSALRHL